MFELIHARMAKEEDDPLDRYPPIIRYLQKLGPDHLNTIFDFSKWIFAEDSKRGLGVSRPMQFETSTDT